MPYVIDGDLCVACGSCIGNCPNRAIVRSGEQIVITNMCSDCGTCLHYCTMGAIGKGTVKAEYNHKKLNQALHEKLSEHALMTSLPEDVVPLGFPLLCSGRNEILQRLYAQKLFCPVHCQIKMTTSVI